MVGGSSNFRKKGSTPSINTALAILVMSLRSRLLPQDWI